MWRPIAGKIGPIRRRLVDDPSVEHDDEAVGQLEQLVEILAHQQHGGAAIARRHDLRVDVGDRREVEAEHRIGGDQHIDLARQLARQHGALDIAARERARSARRATAS